MKVLSLFSGIGGFDLAFSNMGHEIVGACEIDEHARRVYARHFPGVRLYGDVTKINPDELPDCDIIVAGFPCQAFSIAGNRLGFEESRGTLFFEIARIAKQKRPRLLLLENVKGLLSHDNGKTFAVILATLDELGYDAQWQVLNSKYWVPQNRERIFIVANLRETPRPEIFPFREINGVPDQGGPGQQKSGEGIRCTVSTIDSRYGALRNAGETYLIEPELHQVGNIDTKGHNSIWGRVYDIDGIAPTLNSEGGGLGAKTGLFCVPVLTPDRPIKRQNGRRFKTDGEESFTLTAQDKHGIFDGKKVRRLTPLECERLQGFPDGWTDELSDTQRYKCIGNAVTVSVVEWIVSTITL